MAGRPDRISAEDLQTASSAASAGCNCHSPPPMKRPKLIGCFALVAVVALVSSLVRLHLLAAKPLELAGHQRMISSLRFSPDSKLLASGSLDGSARLWDTKTAACIRTLTGPT